MMALQLYEGAFLLIVLLKALSYWLISIRQHPGEPLSILALYRIGDAEYYPLITALSRLQFGEMALAELAGQGVASFPFASILVHAFCYRLLGAAGYILADVVITLGYYAALVWVLRVFGVARFWAFAVGLLVVSGAFNAVTAAISGFVFEQLLVPQQAIINAVILVLLGAIGLLLFFLHSRPSWSPTRQRKVLAITLLIAFPTALMLFSTVLMELWGGRIPRPFVTEIFVLSWVALAGSMAINPQRDIRSKRHWAMLGLVSAALLQGDFHSAIIVTIGMGALIVYLLLATQLNVQSNVQSNTPEMAELDVQSDASAMVAATVPAMFQPRPAAITGAMIYGAVALLTSLPFLLQRLWENPDSPVRLGVFAVNRTQPLWLPGQIPYLLVVGVAVYGALVLTLSRHVTGSQDAPRQRRVLFLVSLAAIACLAMPISLVVLGKGVQLYHFFDRFTRLVLLAMLLLLCDLLPLIYRFLAAPRSGQTLAPTSGQTSGQTPAQKLVALGLITLSLMFVLRDAASLSQASGHVRSDFPEWQALPEYRTSFEQLAAELAKPAYSEAKVIGTFDIQVYTWWLAFQQGHSFLAEAPLTTVADREIEQRLSLLCQLIGMKPVDFLTFINRYSTNIFWLGHNKYQASRAHTFAPLADYSPVVQEVIGNTGILNSLAVQIPIGEQRRLLFGFNRQLSQPAPDRRLDLIVLTNDSSLAAFAPPADRFELTYKNAAFRVWRRRTG
jgi:hypothetical protein